jgi:hypothetical protein
MKRVIYFLFIVLLMTSGCSPMVFYSNKPAVRKELKQYGNTNQLKTIIVETDSTISLFVRDSSKQPLDIVYHYDRSGNWYSKTVSLNCDSCFQKYLSFNLSDKKMEWTKMNNIQYVSNVKQRLELEINQEKPYSYIIRRSSLTRKEHLALLNKKQE